MCSCILWICLNCAGALAATDSIAAAKPRAINPLVQAHSHNDYEHARPLQDALDHGFCSVEADIWLVNGQLLVAHDLSAVRPERTLQALYLDPLRERARTNNNRIFPDIANITLLVDVKSEPVQTYLALSKVLAGYRDLLTEFTGAGTTTRAVSVILSGNVAREVVRAEAARLVAVDGRLTDLESNSSATLVPLVSDNWRQHFTWRGVGPMPESDRRKLDDIVKRTHAQGRKLRFWGLVDKPDCWKELKAAGVDVIGADDLAGLAAFLSP